jgi:hypothetical protein
MFPLIVQAPGFSWLLQIASSWLSGAGQTGLIPATGGACVHSPTTRHCWRDGFDLYTDYEKLVPEGKLVEVSISD